MVNSWHFFPPEVYKHFSSYIWLLTWLPHLSIVVEIPQVKPAHPIHTGKQGRVSWRPHHIINIIWVVFKGVERFIILKKANIIQYPNSALQNYKANR